MTERGHLHQQATARFDMYLYLIKPRGHELNSGIVISNGRNSTLSPGSYVVWRVTCDEDPGEIQKKLQDSWSVLGHVQERALCC